MKKPIILFLLTLPVLGSATTIAARSDAALERHGQPNAQLALTNHATTVYLSLVTNRTLSAPSAAPAIVIASMANIRSGPGTVYRIVTTVTANTSLEAQAQNNGWYKVRTPSGILGWIAGWLVRIDPVVAQELPFAPVTPSSPFPTQPFRATLDRAGGVFGALVYDPVANVQLYAQNEQRVFPAASIIKVSIALTIYHQAWQGQLALNDRLTMHAADIVAGTGSIQYDPPGTSYTIRDLCARMLRESDNTASNLLLKRIGFAAVNGLMERISAKQTRVQRLFMDFEALRAGRDNLTTPADILLVVRVLERGELTGKAGAQELLAAMQQNIWRTKLPALLPADTVIAHKTGSLPGIEHDGGIVYLPGHRYLIVVLSENLPSSPVGEAAIAEVSQLVYRWFIY